MVQTGMGWLFLSRMPKATAARIYDRTVALGLNVVLLVNLAGTAWLSLGFLGGHGTFHRLERWQTAYLPVYGAWAAIVVLVFPPLFGYG